MEEFDEIFVPVSRRDLIKGASIVAAGIGLAGAFPMTALAAPRAPKKGGSLKVGVVGGSNDFIDAQYIIAIPDIVRLVAGWESFMTYADKFQPTTDDALAEEVTAKNASTYVIRVKKGIEFHNGKTVTGDDVVFSFQRMVDPALPGTKAMRAFFSASGVSKIDNRTVQISMSTPNADFKSTLSSYGATLVPVGYTRAGAQIGTGPFKLKSFTPGVESTHTRFANYWDSGKPYLDEVRVLSFADTTALSNALLGGQIHAAINLPSALVSTIKKNKKLAIFENSSGFIVPIAMVIDVAPFNDVRVRQAMRKILDRKKLIKQVLSGYGTISNDDHSPADPNYNANNYPPPKQDIAGALALLKAAGYSKSNPLTFTLPAPDDDATATNLVKAVAEQANSAGGGVIKVNPVIQDSGTFWDKTYMAAGVPCFTTYWNGKPYFPQITGMIDTYQETHFPSPGSSFRDTYKKAIGTVDPAKRRALIAKLQKEEHEKGGYIIPFFVNTMDGYSTKLQGVVKRQSHLPLDGYGKHFKEFWLS